MTTPPAEDPHTPPTASPDTSRLSKPRQPSVEEKEAATDQALLRTTRISSAELIRRWAQRYAQEIHHVPLIGGGPSAEPGRYIIRQAAHQLQQSELVTAAQLNTALYAQERLPRVWDTYRKGTICLTRLRKIVTAAEALTHTEAMTNTELLTEFDSLTAKRAPELIAGKLTSWLNQTIAALNADEGHAQYTQAVTSRRVAVEHRPDGMSEIHAVIPTLEALHIQAALYEAARNLDTPVPYSLGSEPEQANQPEGTQTALTGEATQSPTKRGSNLPITRRTGDARNIDQRQADAFTTWLRLGSVHGTAHSDSDARAAHVPLPGAKIALLIPESTVTGQGDQPAVTADRRAALPAPQIRHYLRQAHQQGAPVDWYTATYQSDKEQESPQGHDTQKHEIKKPDTKNPDTQNRDPLVPKNLLSIVYEGHDPPQRLRDALIFRDGTCQETNCNVPAARCDFDHKIPWNPEAALHHPATGGATTAENLWALCRRHHRQKSHGYLTPPQQQHQTSLPTAKTATEPCPWTPPGSYPEDGHPPVPEGAVRIPF